MIDRVISVLGVDPAQWRALVRVYLRMDLRATGGAVPARADAKRVRVPMMGLLIVTGMSSMMLALFAARMPDVMVSATLLTSYGAINAAMMLLVDFTGLVVSPDDYGVLGHRPVSSRTYFAARLSSILVYVSAMSVTLAAVPSLVYAFYRGLGIPGLVATLGAVALGDAVATVLVITAYALLLGVVHPHRLKRAMAYLQLVSMTAFYGAYYVTTQGLQQSYLMSVEFDDIPGMWANPAAWFAAFIAIAAGHATRAQWLGAGAAATLTILSVPLSAGRLSLDYARRLGELTAAGEPPRRRRMSSLPRLAFRRDEARAIAILIRAQFRFDQKFRLAVLSIVPMILFYLALGFNQGALADPFVAEANPTGAPMYMAVVFMPMALHASLQYSDGWRAAWIFFATPASPARLIVAAKNFVALWFLGGYMLFLAAIWSVFYERVWHAAFHAVVVGMLAHALLQLAIMVKPTLPFANEPRRAERSSRIFAIFFMGSLLASFLPVFLPLVYARPRLTAAVVALMIGLTAALEYALRLRVAEAIDDLEFRA